MPSTAPPILYNLLEEALLSVEDDRGRRATLTLPGLLAALSAGRPVSLTALQAHQQHAMHAFLVQLAAISLTRAQKNDVDHDEASWRVMLTQSARHDGAGPEAFALVVKDLSKPAFLQPPVPEGKLDVLKNKHDRPTDELDVLITSKNMDVKMGRPGNPGVEHWIYGLVALQTTQGFLGAGNYGIARMNGGFSSRPCVAFAPSHDVASRFGRDLRAVLGSREELIAERGFADKGDLGLVWCAPWDGTTSLSLQQLDPFFIEVCRRIRLTASENGTLRAHRGSSKAARIAAKELNGNTGDPWTPVARKDGKALTMAETGFGYDRVQDLLFGEWNEGSAGKARTESGDRLWVGQVLVRGQGKTGGYHERWLPMPPAVQRIFGRKDDRERLGTRSKAWVEKAATVRLKVLKPALLTLLQGAPEKLKFDDDRMDATLRRFDAMVDDRFFPLLFEHADARPEAADEAFERTILDLAKSRLDKAVGALPIPTARRWRAEAQAYRTFWGSARKLLPLATQLRTGSSEDAPSIEGESP